MTGVLVLAATPIGDPRDAAPRLAQELAGADVVAAEDTRRLRRLTTDLGVTIVGRVLSYHEHNEAARTPELVEQLLHQLGRAGGLVVLVVAQHSADDRHPEVGGEAPQPAGVLGCDNVGAGQLLRQPRGSVAGVTDRRGREDEDTAHVRSLR